MTYLLYSDRLETVEADEAEIIQKLGDVHVKGMHLVRERDGAPTKRISHAKAHAFLTGELVVDSGLPSELAQGLFARAARFPVVVRMAAVPGEVLDDRKVSTSRGLAVKVFGVEGERLAGHDAPTQDFVLNTGKTFVVANARRFLAMASQTNALAPRMSEGMKGVVSSLAHAANQVVHVFGGESAKLDFLGHDKLHPLAESYFSQVPLRYGAYVAKLSVTPGDPALAALAGQVQTLRDENALRTLVGEHVRAHGAVLDVNIQLAVDEARTPIEDAAVEWPEDVTPNRRVAQLVLPPQDAFDPQRQQTVDLDYSFSPAHSLAAHRPLGSIMRARLAVYPRLAGLRRSENGRTTDEPH